MDEVKQKKSTAVWDKFWAGKDPNSIYPPVTDIFKELTKITRIKNKKILELGAGTGRDSLKIARAGADVVVLDYSKESLKLVRKAAKNVGIRLVQADARCTPFRQNSFDVVFHQGLLEHFSSPHDLLSDNCRILKKHGLLIVDVPQTYHFYTIFKYVLMFLGIWFAGWERQFTLCSLSRTLKKHHLKPIYLYGDWSRPGIIYKIIREACKKFNIMLPMYPRFFGGITHSFYRLQARLRNKKFFLYTVLSIGIIAKKV